MNRLAVVGAGTWGTALSISLAQRFDEVRLWYHKARHLADFPLPGNVQLSNDACWTLADASIALTVAPSRYLRSTLEAFAPYVRPQTRIVSATKGIEPATLCRMSQVISQALPGLANSTIAVLSGPTFAREIAAGEPAAVVIASEDIAVAEEIQRAFSTSALRFYASTDVIGVELGAALKNVIAIGAGVCKGLGLGSNSVAALVTRGLAEITRLAVRMGGKPQTLSGLAGLGDLVLTATGDLSRNRHVGIQLAQGRKITDILQEMTMVAEGVATCEAAHQLGHQQQVDLPIINTMYQILYHSLDPRCGIRELMDRPLKTE